MPYKDREKQREYQRVWCQEKFSHEKAREERNARRLEWIEKNKQHLQEYDRAWKKTEAGKKYVARDSFRRSRKKRKWLDEIKSELCCSFCGEDHPAVLDFHHKEPSEKEFNISSMISSKMSLETVKKEIEKCIVLCANCHRKLHWEIRNNMPL